MDSERSIGTMMISTKIGARIWYTRISLFLLVLLSSNLSFSQNITLPRSALVIGNANYDNLPKLLNTRNDAVAVGARLSEMGFQLYAGKALLDLNRKAFFDALDGFVTEVQAHKGIAVVYFSGHGVEINGSNYLLPIDLDQGSQQRVQHDAVALSDVLRSLKASGVSAAAIVLDACRDNPLPSSGKGVGEQGLAIVNPPEGMFVIYAASANAKSYDRLSPNDNDRNGLFTRVFLKNLRETPDADIRNLVLSIRTEVSTLAQAANKTQFPAYYDQLSGIFRFSQVSVAPLSIRPLDSTTIGSKSMAPDRRSISLKFDSHQWNELKDEHIIDQHALSESLILSVTKKNIRIINRQTGLIVRSLPAMQGVDYSSASVDPRGRFVVAVGSYSGFFTLGAPEPVFWDLSSGEARLFGKASLHDGGLSDVDISPDSSLVAAGQIGITIYSTSGEMVAQTGTGMFSFEDFDTVRWVTNAHLIASTGGKLVLFELSGTPRTLKRLDEIVLPANSKAMRVNIPSRQVAMIPSSDNSTEELKTTLSIVSVELGAIGKLRIGSSRTFLPSLKNVDAIEPIRLADESWKISDAVFDERTSAFYWFANRCGAKLCRSNTAWGDTLLKEGTAAAVLDRNADRFNRLVQSSRGENYSIWDSGEALYFGPKLSLVASPP